MDTVSGTREYQFAFALRSAAQGFVLLRRALGFCHHATDEDENRNGRQQIPRFMVTLLHAHAYLVRRTST